MRLKNLDLIAAVFVVAINVAWTQVPNRALPVGVMLGLPLVFFLPGYTLVQTLFRERSPDLDSSSAPIRPANTLRASFAEAGRKESNLILRPRLKIGQPVGAADHFILSLGLSMAIDIVVGFALNVLPIGLQALPWTLSLGLVTTVFALLAAFLRRKNTIPGRGQARPLQYTKHITVHECILFGLALLIASLAVWSSIIRPLEEAQSGFTQFWMLPTNNNSCAVRIGVQSFESTSVTYRIVVTTNGNQVITWSSIVLAPQALWDRSVPIKPAATNNIFYIEARLYRADRPDAIYREVHMTLNRSGVDKERKMLC